MTTATNRRRAPGMSPEQRRDMIVRAAIPLLAEHGSTVTTSQIARAAGIGEATIFRVFADKEELMRACATEAMRPDHALDAIAAIPLTDPLPDRLAEAADALDAYLDRMGRVVGALHTSGHGRRRHEETGRTKGEVPDHRPERDRSESMARTRAAVADLFAPERDGLRMDPERLAAVFLGMLLSRTRRVAGDGDPVDVATLIDLFLHGALADPAA